MVHEAVALHRGVIGLHRVVTELQVKWPDYIVA